MPTSPDPRIPAADVCVLRPLLERWTAAQPDRVFVKTSGGPEYTYAQMRALTARTAAGLHALGVRQGDTVVVWMPNGIDCLRTWFAINWLGATYVPINTAYRGRLLAHVLENASAAVLVADASLVGRLAEVDVATVRTVVVFGDAAAAPGLVTMLPARVLDEAGDDAPTPPAPIQPWDTQSIVYTSGTTGPSKGVMSSYAHLFAMSGRDGFPMIRDDDRYLVNLPLFHVGGTIPVMGMLARGGSVSMVDAFSTELFWPQIRETGTTVALLLGVMAAFVTKRAPEPQDRDHPLRTVIIVPLSEDPTAFAARFGVDVYTLYNMTEISTPLVSGLNPDKAGSCGQPRAGVTLRLVDEHDAEVPQGGVGELIVRTDAPWAMNSGYFRNPEATARAWRNGWFHTGDAFRVDAQGTWFFVDRMKDAIRRRGENISSFEVEAEVVAHPAVAEAAVVPVPGEFGEDEVLCVVALIEGATLDPAGLLAFLQPRLAHFMVPRYLRVVPALPKTPTQKVQKHLLRDAGITSDTWDRETAGIRITRATP
jgi:crotonobetaine/carnitine-CoA ligase